MWAVVVVDILPTSNAASEGSAKPNLPSSHSGLWFLLGTPRPNDLSRQSGVVLQLVDHAFVTPEQLTASSVHPSPKLTEGTGIVKWYPEEP
jgi:hypothetical protein